MLNTGEIILANAMDVIKAGLGQLQEELPIANRCLVELRKIRKDIAELHAAPSEIFDFGLSLGLSSASTAEEKIERLTRACIWHAIALKTEFELKLLYTIEAYLSAVDTRNPVSTVLLARYLLELVATVNTIEDELHSCYEIDSRDWMRRGGAYLAILYRARHSTTDEKMKSFFADPGIPASVVRPIKIGKAIKQLTSRNGFKTAQSIYGSLSNICHHNGSGHKMLAERARETRKIVMQNGRRLSVPEKVAAMTFIYPATNFASRALALTARVAWWSAHSANKIITGIGEMPFTQGELNNLTNGRLNSRQCFGTINPSRESPTATIGRNDPCPCGSRRKYKLCCWKNERVLETQLMKGH